MQGLSEFYSTGIRCLGLRLASVDTACVRPHHFHTSATPHSSVSSQILTFPPSLLFLTAVKVHTTHVFLSQAFLRVQRNSVSAFTSHAGLPPPQDSWDPGSLDTVLLQHELPSPRSSSPAPGAPFRSPSLPWLVGSIHHARFSQCHILLRRRGCLASQEALPPQGWTRPRGLERPNLVYSLFRINGRWLLSTFSLLWLMQLPTWMFKFFFDPLIII